MNRMLDLSMVFLGQRITRSRSARLTQSCPLRTKAWKYLGEGKGLSRSKPSKRMPPLRSTVHNGGPLGQWVASQKGSSHRLVMVKKTSY